MVLNELEKGLRHHSLITNDEQRKRFAEIIGMVKREYEEIVKNEVQRAISADEDAIAKLAANYIDNIKAFTLKEKVKNRYTGQDEEPDERLMRSIEEKIDIPENRKDDFRREIMNFIGALAVDGKRSSGTRTTACAARSSSSSSRTRRTRIKLKTLVSRGRRQGHAGEDRHHQVAAHQELRLQRGERDRRAQLRGVDLRPRRREGVGEPRLHPASPRFRGEEGRESALRIASAPVRSR